MLNNAEFCKSIAATRALGDTDPRERHWEEDELTHRFLAHVANTGGTHALGAKLLLEMLNDNVSRWYA